MIFFKILSIIIIIMAFNKVNQIRTDCKINTLCPPSLSEIKDNQIKKRLIKPENNNKLHFIESRIELIDEEGIVAERFSIWMPSKDLGENFILISRAGIIRVETIELVHDLLNSL